LVENHLLINEIQLGNKLNECVHSKRRSDFSLMLAMLTDDAREFSEFALPDNTLPSELSDDEHNELTLRSFFKLPQKASLALNDVSELEQFNEAHLTQQSDLASIHLSNALAPKALSFRDDDKHIASDILDNTSIHTQQRYQANNEALVNKLNFNTNQWLNTIKQASLNTLLSGVDAEHIAEPINEMA